MFTSVSRYLLKLDAFADEVLIEEKPSREWFSGERSEDRESVGDGEEEEYCVEGDDGVDISVTLLVAG